jgi:sugar transferase (PEP-CTERM/EpsH1 system associated)
MRRARIHGRGLRDLNRNSPPLVAHLIYRLDFGGLQNGLVNLVNRMPPERYRHAIVCLAGYDNEFRRRIDREDVEVISVGKRPGKDLGIYGKVWRLLRDLRPAIVHSRNLGTIDLQWMALAAGIHCRVHGEHGWEAADPMGRNPRNLRIRRACRPAIHCYVPMSRDLARWLEHDVDVPTERIRQIYNGVDTGRFVPGSDRAITGHERITIGSIGRLDPVKNQAQLLRAVATVRQGKNPISERLRVLLVGDGPLLNSLRELATELGLGEIVEFAGTRNDTPGLLRSMDVFVLPSLNEGVSNTILEAMATALPVVAARVGGNPELVEHGVTGCLYDPAAPGALATALAPYLADPELRRSHGHSGRERVLGSFGLDRMVQRYADLYDELLDRDPQPRGRHGQGPRRRQNAETRT